MIYSKQKHTEQEIGTFRL